MLKTIHAEGDREVAAAKAADAVAKLPGSACQPALDLGAATVRQIAAAPAGRPDATWI